MDWEKEVILTDAEVIEEECDAVNSTVSFVEIYRNENGFELHMPKLGVLRKNMNLLAP